MLVDKDKGNPTEAILKSLSEHPKQWKFHKDPTYNYIYHKSGFALDFNATTDPLRPRVKIWMPEWAKLFQFTPEEQQKVLEKITALRMERNKDLLKDMNSNITSMLERTNNRTDSSSTISPMTAAIVSAIISFVIGFITGWAALIAMASGMLP
jgi:hypothetical protein